MIITSIFQWFILLSTLSLPAMEPMNAEEMALYELINNYRESKGLSAVPISEKLNKVARAHAKDLVENYQFDPKGKCNPHSWSAEGEWSSCCYTIDHKQAECMWNKPKEIAGYDSPGYEIVYYHSAAARAGQALEGWKSSKSHNPIIINEGIWKQVNWKAIGIGVYKNYAIVWFGELED